MVQNFEQVSKVNELLAVLKQTTFVYIRQK